MIVAAAVTATLWGGSIQPTVAAEGERNVAFRRAVTHSGAADYNHTGHLITDGIISDASTWRITAADQYGDSPSGEGVDNLFDGATDTKWLTFHNTAWVQVAFPAGERHAAVSYVLASANDEANRDPVAWTLQGSVDGKEFVDIDKRSGEDFAARYEAKTYDVATRGEYNVYRLKITKNSGDYRTQLSEFDLLDENGRTLLRPFGDVFDSVWISAGAGEQWVAVDLGGDSRIHAATVRWANENYATAYALQVSPDGKEWRTVAGRQNGTGGVDTLTFDETDARHVRLLCTAAAGENYQLTELEVYGENDVQYTLPAQPAAEADGTQPLTGGNWTVQRASEVHASGEELSAVYDDGAWLPATVPGTVLTSYRNAGAIVDPNVADNQLQISDSFFTSDFWYRNTFTLPAAQKGKRTWLNFNAINWKADVYLNGTYVDSIEGAFIRGRMDITDLARYGEENHLAVYIHQNDHPGAVTEQTLQSAGPNGGVLGTDAPTIHASIGWDWMPTIRGRNIGIYGDVFVDYSDDVTLRNSWVETKLPITGKKFSEATITVRGEVQNPSDHAVTAVVSGRVADTELTFERAPILLAAGETKEVEFATLTLKEPRLWWPNGYGEQYLYTMELAVSENGAVSDTERFRFGVREFSYSTASNRLQILCNGTRIVCTGGNWGMDDSNLAATAADYDTKVRLHAEANFTMIRNWVGMTGNPAFYEACDKYGILVWDDFWLANPGDGPNPADVDMFMKNADDKVRRNRHHASIALYCGRNEGDPPKELDALMSDLTKRVDGTRHYISHSAAGVVSGFGPYSVQTNNWYFSNTPQTLHSERGMPNIPSYESMLAMLTEEHAWPIDNVWGLHDFCTDSAQGASSFLAAMDKYKKATNLQEFTRIAQMVNYEGHKAMFEATHAVNGNGLLMWMSQSAWPSMVWQTYDYYYDTNAGYFAIKHANEPVHALFNSAKNVIQLRNATRNELKDARVVVNLYNLDGSLAHTEEKTLDAQAGLTTAVMAMPTVSECTDLRFVELLVYDKNGAALSRNIYWHNAAKAQEYTALATLPQVTPETSYRLVKAEDGRRIYELTVTNTSNAPLVMAQLKTTKATSGERVLPVYYSDNYLTLMPGEAQTVTAEMSEDALSGDTPAFSVEGWNTSATAIDTEASAPTVLYGDANRDDDVTTADARLILQLAAELVDEDEVDMVAADVSGGDGVTTADARLILQKCAELIEKFPVEERE